MFHQGLHGVPTATLVAAGGAISAEGILAMLPFFLHFYLKAVLATLRADIVHIHVTLRVLFGVEIYLRLHCSSVSLIN
jgi:hypothetical protein